MSQCLGGDGSEGDERGADVLSVGKGRQPLDVHSKQPGEGVCLGVTELRELGRDVLNRAMSLTELNTSQGRACSDRSGGSRETVRDQRRRQCVRSGGDVIAGPCELSGVALLELGAAFASKLGHRLGTGVLGQKLQS